MASGIQNRPVLFKTMVCSELGGGDMDRPSGRGRTFPVIQFSFPDSAEIFPVLTLREVTDKPLNFHCEHGGLWSSSG